MARQRRRGANVAEVIGSLLQCPDPISYYDAFTLTRQLRGQDPSNRVLGALIQLHDADHATDGAREVLAEFLHGFAMRQENQRLIAQRAITAKDNGKTARAMAGDRLALHLEERRAAGYRWEVEQRVGPASVKRDPASAETQSTAIFVVQLQRPGKLELLFEERPPPAGAPQDEQENRRFGIEVIIDERTS